MSEAHTHGHPAHELDTAPGDEHVSVSQGIIGYLVGLGLATLLTIISFLLPAVNLVWGPSIPVALTVLAVAQMGVHLVFFLHITTGPDETNNVMALAFGVLIVLLIIGGSLWIMSAMNHNMAPMSDSMHTGGP